MVRVDDATHAGSHPSDLVSGTPTDHVGRDARSLKEAQLADEQRYVDRVNNRLAEVRAEADELMRHALQHARIGTHAALVDRDVKVAEARRRARLLDAAHDEAVFGRLDLRDGERRYVARIGVRTPDQEPLAIDWRAPAAAAFYRATPEDPMGVVRRRVLHNRLGRVVDLEDDLLDPEAAPDDMPVIGDGAFIAALSRTRDGRMRDVVATIQRDQDEVVRAAADATVVLRGGPGTGKTVVALHRVAWLLFHHRRRFGSRGVLVIGPNPRFTAYIERVLPSLGEDGVVLRSLGDLFPGVVARRHDEPALAAVKGSDRMVRVLRRAAHAAPAGAPDRLRLVHRGTVIQLGNEDLARVRRNALRGGRRKPNRLRRAVRDALVDAAWRRYVAVTTSAGDPTPDADDRERFVDDVSEDDAMLDFMAAWWPVRGPEQVLAELTDQDRLARFAERGLRATDLTRLAGSWREIPTRGYSYLDVALLDELADLLGEAPARRSTLHADTPYVVNGEDLLTGEQRDDGDVTGEVTTFLDRATARPKQVEETAPEYGHIVVDEAQDLAPMQWRMLGRRGGHATWTVVADDAQRSWDDARAAEHAMSAALGSRRRLAFELTVNYRNPTEIAEIAATLLRRRRPDAVPARAVRGSGIPPLALGADARPEELPALARQAVEALLTEVDGTIGVITPMSRPLASTSEPLAGLPDRVQTLGALEAKGLEFDAVVLVAPAEIAAESPSGLRTLYVAVTRATRALVTVGPLGVELVLP
jgi:DNA helicase IV